MYSSCILQLIFFCFSASFAAVLRQNYLFELNVIHMNDFHARFLETNWYSGTCKQGNACIGGFSRLFGQITKMLKDQPNSLLLNAGDDFQGTLWYTVGKWNVTQQFINKLPFDAQVLGNHEFDDGVDGVVPYIKSLQHPIVVSNMDDSLEASIQGIYSKSVVVNRMGKKIGIIGVIASDCAEIASTGKLRFFPESPSVNAEAERLVKEEGVFTNIVLSHSGYEHDKIIARNASEKISLVVGGHSHTFLYTGDNPPGPDKPIGPYPTIVKSKHGHNVLVTQASSFTKYLGNITVYLDANGEVVDFRGAPIFLSSDLPQDAKINEELQPWKDVVESQGKKVVGSTLVSLNNAPCYIGECTIGNFFTDAMVFAYTKYSDETSWTYASIATLNAGAIRASIDIGNITYEDILTSSPFGNTMDVGEIEGKYLRELLEYNMEPYSFREPTRVKLLQYSGVQVIFDMARPRGKKIVSAKIRCQNCTIPVYEDLDDNKLYRIVVPTFLADGKDGYIVLKDHLKNIRTGPLDVDVLVDYLAHRSPLIEEIEGRTIVINRGYFT